MAGNFASPPASLVSTLSGSFKVSSSSSFLGKWVLLCMQNRKEELPSLLWLKISAFGTRNQAVNFFKK